MHIPFLSVLSLLFFSTILWSQDLHTSPASTKPREEAVNVTEDQNCAELGDQALDWKSMGASHSLRPVSVDAFSQVLNDPSAFWGDSGESKVYRSTAIKTYCDLIRLKRMGFTTIIRPSAVEKNSRTRIDNLALEKETALAKAAGIQIITLPMYLSKEKMDALSEEELKVYKKQLDDLVSEMDSLPGKVLIHCFHGRDRTGLLASMYLAKKLGGARTLEINNIYFLNYPVEDLAYRGSPYQGPGIAFKKFYNMGDR